VNVKSYGTWADLSKYIVSCMQPKFSIPLLDILGLCTNDLLLRKGIKHKT